MAIPKIIHQTFKTSRLPLLTRWHIARLKRKNPDYRYEFYDDERADQFIKNNFNEEIFELYKKINIGAAKADFFRYAVLYKTGGVYLDIDSLIIKPIDSFVRADDVALVAEESHPGMFVQWALIYSPEHPFLAKTLEMVLDNLRHNRFPHDVHQMTGPTVYSNAIRASLTENAQVVWRNAGIDYNGNMKFHYPMSKFFLYGFRRKNHWHKAQALRSVLRD